MIQRLLYQVISVGIETISADPTLLDKILRNYDLTTAELKQVRDLWIAKPPHVKHHYARSDDDFPLYAIVLGNETESELYLGDDAGVVLDEDDELYGADREGAIWEHTYQVLCYTEHPEHTIYNYEVAKTFLSSAPLVEAGLHGYRLSGADLMPDPRYLPPNLFARALTLLCRSEYEQVDADSRFQKAYQVAGIHVDKAGSNSDVGGVKTLVTLSTENGDG